MNTSNGNSRDTQTDSLQGKVVVLTGAGGGIASAIVDRFARSGSRIVLLELRTSSLADAEQRLAAAGIESVSIECDVADESSVKNAAGRTVEHFGRCDVLINNAATLAPATSIEKLLVADWDRTLAINLRGVFLTTKYLGALMLNQGSGSIVNIASIAATAPNASPQYGASKAAVLAFTRHTAVEWGPRGIRANAVSPGFIRTPLSESNYAEPEMLARRSNMVPSRRLGLPGDIAEAVAFLAGDGASFINGQELAVDGGFMQTTLMHAQPKAEQYGGWQPAHIDFSAAVPHG
ncbi:short chain dehydrogenase family protein [Paraburkholderia xenovorans LB400]|uniref:Dehydrogenase n=1 Tax=Paraburkholderia xenovorans (strain LB400) TaxID=266265 RepID=Q143W5_PARXL|nr:SDR family NAD(P)-dependent oxidoreductase [Paraburkholderia xenovorans]ABE29374.1 Putative dehydrogenase [Paraburkholderia xenovorans LB400]AIP29794.1 short chain dehydrogenase family protein [Paraburkholderia xenovorans LB400]